MSQQANRTQAIIVLGMHRSGTSALTGMLSLLGNHVGSSLIPPHPEINPKGYWENPDIASIHDRALGYLRSSWHDERSLHSDQWQQPAMEGFRKELLEIIRKDYRGSRRWIVKDPRLCRLLPLWVPLLKTLADETKIIIVVRHPNEVAASLKQRDGISFERAYLMWIGSMIDAEKASRAYPRTVVSYDTLLKDWRAVANQIATVLDLPYASDDLELKSKVDDFLDPGLRHFVATRHSESRSWLSLAEAIYDALLNTPDQLRLQEEMARLEVPYLAVQDQYQSWSEEIQSLWETRGRVQDKLYECQARLSMSEDELLRVKSTLSWRVTKPLRLIANLPRFLRRWCRQKAPNAGIRT